MGKTETLKLESVARGVVERTPGRLREVPGGSEGASQVAHSGGVVAATDPRVVARSPATRHPVIRARH